MGAQIVSFFRGNIESCCSAALALITGLSDADVQKTAQCKMSRRDGTLRQEWTSGRRERSSLTTRLLAQTEIKLLGKYLL